MATPTSASQDQDPWELAKSRFLEDLEPHETALFKNATLENIYYSTSNANRDDAERSKTHGVVRRLGPLVSAIESYGGAFDAFAQISPQYLLPIWGSIRVVLVVASSYRKFYDKIVDTLSRIGDILPRFRDYERIYKGQKHKRLTQALSHAYLDIVTLCSEFRRSIREQKTSKVRRILKPLAFDKQFEEAIDRFRQHRQNVEDEARTCHMIEAAEQRDAQLVLFTEERRRNLLARLSKVDSKHRHRKLKESRHEGTGMWFTACSEYEEWQTASQSSVLCCYGIPGCGKSVLVSSVIDSFKTSGTLIFHYCDYADKRTLEPSNVFGAMARQALDKVEILPETLASEIEHAEHDGEKLTHPSKALMILQKSLVLVPGPIYLFVDGLDEATESSQNIIYNKLKQVIEKSEIPVKLLITGREELGSLLMLNPSIPFSRVTVSSNVISLDIEKYVRASTRQRILDGSLVISDPALEQLIVSELANGAKGMFLWVEFQLHDLCEPESDHGIRLVLQNLPKSLGETYNRLLSKIEAGERKDMIQRMFKWIVCAREPIHLDELREAVAFTLDDLVYDPRKLPTEMNRLIRACGNLVVVDEETHVVQLAHHTIQQYLLQQDGSPFQFTIKDANVMAGEFCVTYLSFSNFESQVTRYADNKNRDMLALGRIASHGPMLLPDLPGERFVRVWNTLRNTRPNALEINMTRYVPPQKREWQHSNFQFLSYVVAHWLWHTISFDIPDDNQEDRRERLFKNLILTKQLLFEFKPWGDFNRDARESSSTSLIGWALMANHRYMIRTASYDISLPSIKDAWEATCKTFLWKIPVIQHPLLHRPYLHSFDNFGLESPSLVWLFGRLVFACTKGHLDVIEELDLNVNLLRISDLQEEIRPMFLYLIVAAAATGKLEVVQHLCNRVVQPFNEFLVRSDLTKGQNLSAIEHAAISGHLRVVAYLADQGVRPSHIFDVSGSFQRFFDGAINDNDVRKVESLLLLRSLKDITLSQEVVMSDQHLSNILVKAITDGRTEVVQLLLKHGVDPDRCDQLGSTPLLEAIRHSHESIVSMLLNHHCALGDTSAGMPLTIAACVGNFFVARELILHGAEDFGASFETESMLKLASVHETYSPIDRVRPDPELIYRRICLSATPLYMACFYGHLSIVELLLNYGAATNFPSPAGLTWIMEKRNGSTVIVNSTPGWHLHNIPDPPQVSSFMASGLNHEDAVAAVTSGWALPITAAMARGREAIVNILISHGALWPEEFDCLYGSCVGSEQDKFRARLINLIMTDYPPKTEYPRTRMREIGTSTMPAHCVRFVGDLQILDVGSTALRQERVDSRISDLQDEIQKSEPHCRDPLQACLVKAAQNNESDVVEALVQAGASLFNPDDNGILVPHDQLVRHARQGNTTLRHTFLDMGVAAVISYIEGFRTAGSQEESRRRRLVLQRVVKATAATLSPSSTNILDYCDILENEFVVIPDLETHSVRELYEILMFSSTDVSRSNSALFAAVDHGNADLVRILCKYGANVNARDYNGLTPLLYAAERGVAYSIIDELLAHGADSKAVDNAGENIFFKVATSDNFGILHRLMRFMHGPELPSASDLREALEVARALCVSRTQPEAWKRIAVASLGWHAAKPFKDIPPHYDLLRGDYLSRRSYHHVQGLFELPAAAQDEIEATPLHRFFH